MFVSRRRGPKARDAFTRTRLTPTFLGSQPAFLLNIAGQAGNVQQKGRLRVQRWGFRGLGVRGLVSGFRVQGSGFRVQGSGFRVQGSGFRVLGWSGPKVVRPCAGQKWCGPKVAWAKSGMGQKWSGPKVDGPTVDWAKSRRAKSGHCHPLSQTSFGQNLCFGVLAVFGQMFIFGRVPHVWVNFRYNIFRALVFTFFRALRWTAQNFRFFFLSPAPL